MNYVFTTPDHPEANGRQPVVGDQAWTVFFPTDDGGKITVRMGADGRKAICSMLQQEEADNAADLKELVRRMRAKQREYFRHRTDVVLRECKDLERRVDEALAPVKTPSMFTDEPDARS